MSAARETLADYLTLYAAWQKDILLLQRFAGQGWNKRCTYNSKEYCPIEHYNHRNILDNEIVIEFDCEKQTDNGKLAGLVANRLKAEDMDYIAWSSGNKSVHVHAFFDMSEVRDLKLMKRSIMTWLCFGLLHKPDFQLAIPRHLIRAEFGLHEKTNKHKTKLMETENYPALNKIPPVVWDVYNEAKAYRLKQSIISDVEDLATSPSLKKMLDTVTLKTKDDGRERVLFVLIHALKPKHTKESLTSFLTEWYFATGGKKMSARDIKNKINNHWSRNYTMTEKYLQEVLIDIGID